MTRDVIINELNLRGFNAVAADITRNSVVFPAICVGNGEIKHTIYSKSFEDASEDDIDLVVEEILYQMNSNMPDIDLCKFKDWEFVRTKLLLCLQRKSNENICKRELLNLELYVRIVEENSNGLYSIKVNSKMLELFGITENELFDEAKKCSLQLVNIYDMAEIVSKAMGVPLNDILSMPEYSTPIIVVSNKYNIHGASSIIFTNILKEIADKYERDLVILPSSIHECLLYPVENNVNLDYYTAMVNEVNETNVLPEETLSDNAYLYLRNKQEIVF